MEQQRLCRLCARISDEFVNLFDVDGLRLKIETCLPITVTNHSLLPSTICRKCEVQVDTHFGFISQSLESILILEEKLAVSESCLNSKRRKNHKATNTDAAASSTAASALNNNAMDFAGADSNSLDLSECHAKIVEFAAKLTEAECAILGSATQTAALRKGKQLVDYADSEPDESEIGAAAMVKSTNIHNKLYFDDSENNLISEISERKNNKRKLVHQSVFAEQQQRPAKVSKLDHILNSTNGGSSSGNNKRKNRIPMKVSKKAMPEERSVVPQVCLLCDLPFDGPLMLAHHVFETHGIDMAQIINNSCAEQQGGGGPMEQSTVPSSGAAAAAAAAAANEKRSKKLPNLLKITDLNKPLLPPKQKNVEAVSTSVMENKENACQPSLVEELPPTLTPTYVCSLCPASLTNKSDLFEHLRLAHPSKMDLVCGLCDYTASSYLNLTDHLETCSRRHQITNPYICKVCKYSDENQSVLENHILVHDFIISFCKKDGKIFDPSDYVEVNPKAGLKVIKCSDCEAEVVSFKEFSAHRRQQHGVFHCDLCSKFYGRNSHLWKHVNRLHKGHPSITCQFCYRTSASKYHLNQHFQKIHSVKSSVSNQSAANSVSKKCTGDEDFLQRKFEAFDFQSVRQSFLKQELLEKSAPKELDTSSNLYTNIITNYTPPSDSGGEFKCPKCSKGFHKRTLLRKHKKNCRPRSQKDLLTRCKTCSRIFKDRQSLGKHLVNYHSEYACEICAQKVQSKCEIVSHIRFTHPNSELLVCPHCKNVLRTHKEQQEHLADHNNSFVCQFCGDLLPSKIKLKMHILSLHRKILSLSCGICLKLFETQHILREHVRLVHSDMLQPLTSCTVCGKNYGSKWKTFDHMNKSHGRIFKACKTCLEVFDSDAELAVHVEVVHGNTNNAKIGGREEPKELKPEVEIVKMPNVNAEDDSDSDIESDTEKLQLNPSVSIHWSSLNNNKRSIPKEDPEESLNSSKRTVYINSNDPSICEICHKQWPAKKHLWQHYIRCHKQVAATVCGICLCTNKNYETLQEHLNADHPNLLYGIGVGSNFICRICGRYHNARSKLRLHMAIHDNFDWGLLELMELDDKDKGMADDEDAEDDKVDEASNNVNYESLIEQVECSSESFSTSKDDNDDENDDDDDNEENEEDLDEDDDVGEDGEVYKKEVSNGKIEEICSETSDEDEDDENDDNDDNDEEDDDEEENEENEDVEEVLTSSSSSESEAEVEEIEELDDDDEDEEVEDEEDNSVYEDLNADGIKEEIKIEEADEANDEDYDEYSITNQQQPLAEIQSAVDSIL